jgi:hypothetical protein
MVENQSCMDFVDVTEVFEILTLQLKDNISPWYSTYICQYIQENLVSSMVGITQNGGTIQQGVSYWLNTTINKAYDRTTLPERNTIVSGHHHEGNDQKRCCSVHISAHVFDVGEDERGYHEVHDYLDSFAECLEVDFPQNHKYLTFTPLAFSPRLNISERELLTPVKVTEISRDATRKAFIVMLKPYILVFTHVKILGPVFMAIDSMNYIWADDNVVASEDSQSSTDGHFESTAYPKARIDYGKSIEEKWVRFRVIALIYGTFYLYNDVDKERLLRESGVNVDDLEFYSGYIASHWYMFLFGDFANLNETPLVCRHSQFYKGQTNSHYSYVRARPGEYVQASYFVLYLYLDQVLKILIPLKRMSIGNASQGAPSDLSKAKAIIAMERALQWGRENTGPNAQFPGIDWESIEPLANAWNLRDEIEKVHKEEMFGNK